ncbi:MAG TPA: hypothetical protein VI072_02550 [Polyangiaceae bacterium]
MPRVSAAERCALFLLAAALYAPSARADHCQPPGPLPPGEVGLRLATSLEAAAYEYGGIEGSYQGAALSASYTREAFRAELTAPAYRLRRNDETFYGLGDVTGELRVRLLEVADGALSGGAGLTGIAPTGSASRDLGMGHVMLMPALWGVFEQSGAFVQLQVAYARALSEDDSEHAHHAPRMRPIVRPMNASELVVSGSAGYAVHELVRVQGGVYTAAPVDTPDGEGRTVASLGVDFIPSAFDASVEAQAPLAGDPYTFKVVVGAGVRF